jgi:hypothetical protein
VDAEASARSPTPRAEAIFYCGVSASHATAHVPIIAAATGASCIPRRFAAFYCAASADLLAGRAAVRWEDPPSRCSTPILCRIPRATRGENVGSLELSWLDDAESGCPSLYQKQRADDVRHPRLPVACRPATAVDYFRSLGCFATPQPERKSTRSGGGGLLLTTKRGTPECEGCRPCARKLLSARHFA